MMLLLLLGVFEANGDLQGYGRGFVRLVTFSVRFSCSSFFFGETHEAFLELKCRAYKQVT